MGIAMGGSFFDICAAVEKAASRKELVKALGPFNSLMHIFLGLTTEDMDDRNILNAVSMLPSSARFQELFVLRRPSRGLSGLTKLSLLAIWQISFVAGRISFGLLRYRIVNYSIAFYRARTLRRL